jgi:hypothetical protein
MGFLGSTVLTTFFGRLFFLPCYFADAGQVDGWAQFLVLESALSS